MYLLLYVLQGLESSMEITEEGSRNCGEEVASGEGGEEVRKVGERRRTKKRFNNNVPIAFEKTSLDLLAFGGSGEEGMMGDSKEVVGLSEHGETKGRRSKLEEIKEKDLKDSDQCVLLSFLFSSSFSSLPQLGPCSLHVLL